MSVSYWWLENTQTKESSFLLETCHSIWNSSGQQTLMTDQKPSLRLNDTSLSAARYNLHRELCQELVETLEIAQGQTNSESI